MQTRIASSSTDPAAKGTEDGIDEWNTVSYKSKKSKKKQQQAEKKYDEMGNQARGEIDEQGEKCANPSVEVITLDNDSEERVLSYRDHLVDFDLPAARATSPQTVDDTSADGNKNKKNKNTGPPNVEDTGKKCRELYEKMNNPKTKSKIYASCPALCDQFLKDPSDYEGFSREYAICIAAEKERVASNSYVDSSSSLSAFDAAFPRGKWNDNWDLRF
ncbi:hypothetical protein PENTCL1PPCAC_22190 [Pristionchus entomophagus]|uniref:Uncharacterized protein n=1 Tax=Pristionchus entomophagus TaxID=358040 RepID=A0AAV5TZH4_9BILA|nr:hypothetical protein PENTCL1PPCAC_22190 [Pristionchus entomophagus]